VLHTIAVVGIASLATGLLIFRRVAATRAQRRIAA
jgi:hypothetical protein